MQGKLAADVPPDTFQSLAGGELKTYVDGGYLDNVDDIWAAQGLDRKYPAVLGRMVTFNGHKMAIPVSIHRANWLFYNVPVFTQLRPRCRPTDVDELIADAKVLAAHGITPIGLGTRDKWTAVFPLRRRPALGCRARTSTSSSTRACSTSPRLIPRIRTAFPKFAELMPYVYPDHGSAHVERHADAAGQRQRRDDGPGRLRGAASYRRGLRRRAWIGKPSAFPASPPRSS